MGKMTGVLVISMVGDVPTGTIFSRFPWRYVWGAKYARMAIVGSIGA
jgi:hypothetical protein